MERATNFVKRKRNEGINGNHLKALSPQLNCLTVDIEFIVMDKEMYLSLIMNLYNEEIIID